MSARQMITLAAAACVACCIGPIIGLLGAVAAAGILSTIWTGLLGVAIAVGAITATVIVRRRRTRCATAEIGTPVALTSKPFT